MPLKGKKILVGLTGGIACYKVPYLVRFLKKDGAEVRCIMTKAATEFITPLTLEAVSEQPVATDLFPKNEFVSTRHIDLAGWPDLIVIAPATANFLGKINSGVSDDLLTTVICASAKPVLMAPAMNPTMWLNKVTQRNFKSLKELGYHFIGPEEGDTACGQLGVGRMAEPEAIYEKVLKDFFKVKSSKKKLLEGRRFVITAGPSQEIIDPVRFISNYSSGKMGYAVAEAALVLGAEVTLISGPSHLKPPTEADFISIKSTEELYLAVSKAFGKADCLVMAAAPADYAPEKISKKKMKKTDKGMTLKLKATKDILREIGKKKKKNQVLVGFALETNDGIKNARKKMTEKNLDLIVLNNLTDKGAGFDVDTNVVTVISPNSEPEDWPLAPKIEIAEKLLEKIAALF